MKVFTNNTFEGYYPVGTAAVVVAKTPEDAAMWLNNVLDNTFGLRGDVKPEQMHEVELKESAVHILCNGDY